LDVDIVLVTREGPATAAAQRHRLDAETEAWPGLDRSLRETARGLATRASAGNLVLFLGAGVSVGAGLPTWSELLNELAAEANVQSSEMPEFVRLSPLDRASFVERRLGRGAVIARIETRLHAQRFSLVHALLANIPAREAVTTNYDRCFELACAESGGPPIAVLPDEPASQDARWLLKLHGCIERKRIVLTRSDYLRYDDQRAALLGLVQALLITRHMLFIGFSLNDENFHRIIDEVRKVVPAQSGPERHGTALLVGVDPVQAELWNDDLDCLHFGDITEGAREQMVFLDYVAAHSGLHTAHLLDDRYLGSLSDGERMLRGRLQTLLRDTTDAEKATPAWGEIEKLAVRLGGFRK
jgi:hypothetical protein